MKRYFFLPTQANWSADLSGADRARLQPAILAAIRRAIDVSASASAEIVIPASGNEDAAREFFAAGRYRSERETYAIPSYDNGGAPTEVPVGSTITFEDALVIGQRDQVLEGEPPFQGKTVLSLPGNQYAFVRSHRYATTGDVGRAYAWGRTLFGAEAWVIAARGGRRGNVTYYVAALDRSLAEADLRVQRAPGSGRAGIPGETGEYFHGRILESLPGGYSVIAVGFRGGGFSAPTMAAYNAFIGQVQEARRQGTAALDPQIARASVFKPIDDLIALGGKDNLERAAELLAELDAVAFALLDWRTKAAYLQVLVNAWTEEPQEKAIVEILKSVESRSELDAALGLLRQAGIFDKLFNDLDSQIWTLVVDIGKRLGDPRPVTFQFMVELLQEAGLMPRDLSDIAKKIVLGPIGPVIGEDLWADLEEAALSFVRFLGGAIEGIVMMVAHPDKLIEGIGQLVKMAAIFQLAQLGHPPAIEYTNNLIKNMAQQVLYGLKGAQVMGFTARILRRIKWAIVWEVASWFIGVGEVKAILSSVGITEKVAALGRFLRILRLFGRGAEAEKVASKLEHLAKLLRQISVISHEDEVLRLMSHLPEGDIARLARALESTDVHAVQNMAQLAARHPELAEAAQHALGRAEALAQLEIRAGRLTDNLVEGFQRLAGRSGFNNKELLELMAAVPSENAELFMRAMRAMPDRAFGDVIGARGYNFFNNLAQHPRSMQFLIEANYDTFSALYRHSNYGFARFEENLAALEDLARKLPADQRAVGYRNLLDRLAGNDPGAIDELRQAVNTRRAAGGRPPIQPNPPLHVSGGPKQVTLNDMMAWEREGGHTLARHGPQHTRTTLRDRIIGERDIPAPRDLPGGGRTTDFRVWQGKDSRAASRWIDDETMNNTLSAVINDNLDEIVRTTGNGGEVLLERIPVGRRVGEGWVTTGGLPGHPVPAAERGVFWLPELQHVTIVIRPNGRGGWYVLTAYPS